MYRIEWEHMVPWLRITNRHLIPQPARPAIEPLETGLVEELKALYEAGAGVEELSQTYELAQSRVSEALFGAEYQEIEAKLEVVENELE